MPPRTRQPRHAMKISERRRVRGTLIAWYACVLLSAGIGQTTGLVNRLGLWWVVALVPVFALELGGVVVTIFADYRRRLNESAWGARVLAGFVASVAVAINLWGHWATPGLAGFFAAMSIAGYWVYLMDSAARRRDRRYEATGRLPVPDLEYSAFQWIAHPKLTRLAVELGRREALDKAEGLDRARQEMDARRRRQAVARWLQQDMAQAYGPAIAALIATASDRDDLARKFEERAQWDGIIDVLVAQVDPARYRAVVDARTAKADRARRRGRSVVGPTNPTNQPTTDPTKAPDQPTSGRAGGRVTNPTTTRPTTRPKRAGQPTTNPTNQPDHSDRSVMDAATVRLDFPAGLPPERGGVRLLRDTYRWSNGRANNALAAYVAGADLEALVGPTTNPTNPTARPRGGDQ